MALIPQEGGEVDVRSPSSLQDAQRGSFWLGTDYTSSSNKGAERFVSPGCLFGLTIATLSLAAAAVGAFALAEYVNRISGLIVCYAVFPLVICVFTYRTFAALATRCEVFFAWMEGMAFQLPVAGMIYLWQAYFVPDADLDGAGTSWKEIGNDVFVSVVIVGTVSIMLQYLLLRKSMYKEFVLDWRGVLILGVASGCGMTTLQNLAFLFARDNNGEDIDRVVDYGVLPVLLRLGASGVLSIELGRRLHDGGAGGLADFWALIWRPLGGLSLGMFFYIFGQDVNSTVARDLSYVAAVAITAFMLILMRAEFTHYLLALPKTGGNLHMMIAAGEADPPMDWFYRRCCCFECKKWFW